MHDKIALFYNPVAGTGYFKSRLDSVIQQFQDSGLQVIPWRISNNAQIIEQVGKMNPDQYHSIVAAGGDGTIHGVVNAMMKTGLTVPLGIFPEGTSNDVANYLKIPGKIHDYCRVVADGVSTSVDVGLVNDKYFLNVASAGFLTQTAHDVDHRFKNTLGKMAYYLKSIEKIPKIQPLQLRLKVDDVNYNMEIFLFLILNGGTAGGFQGILPQGKMNDGMLDFLAIKSVPIHRLAQLIYNFTRGQLLEDQNIFYCQGKHFNLEIDPLVATDLDGEKGPNLPWNVHVCPNALQIRTL